MEGKYIRKKNSMVELYSTTSFSGLLFPDFKAKALVVDSAQ